MIIDQPQSHFIFGYHSRIKQGYKYIAYKGKPLTNKEYLDYWGKWLVLGSKEMHDKLARRLDPYVEEGLISCFKYDRRPLKHLGMEECIMCVYCDERNSDSVWNILERQGIKLKAWVNDRDTIEMWLPGGRLLENWIKSENLSEKEAEKVRTDSRKRFSLILDHPDEPFAGWPQ